MALMQCSECGGQVSDQAGACPHCGCPLNVSPTHADVESVSKQQPSWKDKFWYIIVCVVAFFAFKGCFYALKNSTAAEKRYSVEDVAQMIAEQNTRMLNASKNEDPNLVDAKFYARGKTVYMEYINNTRRDISPQDIASFDAEVKSFVIPSSCRMNKDNPAFPRGLRYVMIYKSVHGQKLSEFVIDKSVCDSLK